MQLTGQSINIPKPGTNDVSEFVLCIVCGLRRMETPNEDARYIAELRDVDMSKNGQSVTHEYRCIVPVELQDVVFRSLGNDTLLLASIQCDFLESVIEIPDFTPIDVKEYDKKHRQLK